MLTVYFAVDLISRTFKKLTMASIKTTLTYSIKNSFYYKRSMTVVIVTDYFAIHNINMFRNWSGN